jgi:mono/diheme cytochrome c family protein
MKYLLLILFLVAVFGSVFASLARSGAPATVSDKSAVELYAKKCASCHGKDGRAKTFKGKFNHARDLSDHEWQDRASDERIFNSIMNGKGKMPGFGKKLSEPEINGLVAYVRSLKK